MKTVTLENCRLCNSESITDLFSLGNQYVSDFVDQDNIMSGVKAPLDIVICENCELLQLKHTAPQNFMYTRHYWYKSGINTTMKIALKEIVTEIESTIQLGKDDCVLDIGANDGTLLANYSAQDIIKVGCEPATNLIEELSENCDYMLDDFWSYEKFKALGDKNGFKKAKVITAIGMFYDLENPNKFINDIRKALSDDGIFIAQLMCLAPMLEKNDVGNICHEHLEYYSFKALQYLYHNNDLEIFNISENNVNGGSYRIYARPYSGTGIDFDELISVKDILNFADRIAKNKEECVAFIKNEVGNGKTVYVYGASTKGNVILQYYGLDSNWIVAAADKSPEKWGRYTVGTGIPIISEEQARIDAPDYFLVLPWAFFDEFYTREAKWRESGGKFILPIPDFKVIE